MRLLDEERPVIVFPEGIQGIGKPFRERYQLKRFGRGGFVKLALRTGAPIVPVAIVGAEESMPLLGEAAGRLPRRCPYLPVTPLPPAPRAWSIRFGEPIDLVDGAGRGRATTSAWCSGSPSAPASPSSDAHGAADERSLLLTRLAAGRRYPRLSDRRGCGPAVFAS